MKKRSCSTRCLAVRCRPDAGSGCSKSNFKFQGVAHDASTYIPAVERRQVITLGHTLSGLPLFTGVDAVRAEEVSPSREKLMVPSVLIGCWQLLERNRSFEVALNTLAAYAEAGFTTFDTADIYGPSEAILGEFRKQYLQKKGDASRKDVTFFTKYVTRDASEGNAREINARSREKLGVDKLDVVQYCWFSPFRGKEHVDAATNLVTLQKEGKIQHLAGCNYDTIHLKELVDAGIPIEANQVQYSLLDLRVENQQLEYCKSAGIQLTCFGTVGGGWLSDTYLGQPHPGSSPQGATVSKRMYRSSLGNWGDWALFQRLLQTLRKIGDKQNCSIANVAVAWVQARLAETCGGGVIIGVRDASHLEDLKRQSSIKLSADDMMSIREVLMQGAKPAGDAWSRERRPF